MARDAEQSKRKILQVAEKVFAQKGFDGARVDEIAREAGVNKALLYYYFKSKKQILEEIIKQFVEVFIKMIARFSGNAEGFMDSDQLMKIFQDIMGFLEEKKDILRIILSESLKSNNDAPVLFKVMEMQFDSEMSTMIDEFKTKGLYVDDHMGKMMVTEFFTGLMPLINYVVYADKWSRYFKTDPEDLKKWFMEAYKDTHVAHHKRHLDNLSTSG